MANSYKEKSPERHLSSGVGISQSCGTSLAMSLADSHFFVYSILNQLQGNQVGGNRVEVVCESHSTGQAVKCISCQPTGVYEIGVIDSLGPTIFSFFIKIGQQGRNS